MKPTRVQRLHVPLGIGLLSLLFATAAVADPPGRVARIAYIAGEVSFAPAGEDTWYAAQLNRPLVAGDQLWTSRGSRIELELGGVVFRLDEGSHFEFLSLNDAFVQTQLSEGTVNLRIDHVHAEQVYEIATPTLAFVAAYPGEFRLDIEADGSLTQVTVFDGHATVYGEDGNSLALRSGSSYRFHTPGQLDHHRLVIAAPDDFDRWTFARNDRYRDSTSRQYVSTEMIGHADLDHHGSWRHVADYGHVWFPRRVVAGWAPYRHGRWSWIDPWGWTWIDDAPWGFAPFHYGRWVYVANGWGWVPGPRHLRPVYAPALVAFIGGPGWSLTVSSAGPPVGWFPLGPRDVYMPWYRCSRGYFSRVNVHNTYVFNNIYVTNIYNDYYVQGRPLRRDYTFRGAVNAVTVVPRDAFVSSRSAAESMARLRPGVIDRGEILARPPASTTRTSLVGGSERHAAAPPARALNRSVVARSEPPGRPASFEMRERAIARNGGEPLAQDQMRRLSAARGEDGVRTVRVIGRDGAGQRTPSRAMAEQNAPATRSPSRTVDRANAGARPAPRDGSPAVGTLRERALPSARYSPRGDAAATSEASVRPGTSRAPTASDTPTREVRARDLGDRGAMPVRGSTSPSAAQRERTPAPAPTPAMPTRSTRGDNDGIPLPRSSTPRREPAAPPVQRAPSPAPRSTPAPQREDTWSRAAGPEPRPVAPPAARGVPRQDTGPRPTTVEPRRSSSPSRAAPIPAPVRETPARPAPTAAPTPRSATPSRQSTDSAPVQRGGNERSVVPERGERPAGARRGRVD